MALGTQSIANEALLDTFAQHVMHLGQFFELTLSASEILQQKGLNGSIRFFGTPRTHIRSTRITNREFKDRFRPDVALLQKIELTTLQFTLAVDALRKRRFGVL